LLHFFVPKNNLLSLGIFLLKLLKLKIRQVIRYLKNLILNKIIQDPLTTEKKYLISKKNPWLNPKDNFVKLERGKVE